MRNVGRSQILGLPPPRGRLGWCGAHGGDTQGCLAVSRHAAAWWGGLSAARSSPAPAAAPLWGWGQQPAPAVLNSRGCSHQMPGLGPRPQR